MTFYHPSSVISINFQRIKRLPILLSTSITPTAITTAATSTKL